MDIGKDLHKNETTCSDSRSEHALKRLDGGRLDQRRKDDSFGHQPPSVIVKMLRWLLGAVFIYASYDKILEPQAFAQAVYHYQILPDALVNLTAIFLPWLELLLGLSLISGIWLPGATMVSTGLLAVFMGALLFNQARGFDINCGCFSADMASELGGWWTVSRDLLFLSIATYLFFRINFFKSADMKPGHSDHSQQKHS